ncbi:MAG: glycosyltransferase [Planctomycetota bacterium]|nr:MAG: glycosyltransferase [Planctomycetota bacterium]
MAAAPQLSLVVPVYEEEENLPILFREIRAALEGTGIDFEILAVDDGSGDGSWERIRAETVADARVRGLRFERNCGQTAAFAAGFRAARGGIIVTLDSDLQNDPADIPRMLQVLEERQADVVLGIRRNRHDNLIRRLSSKVANGYRRWRTRDDTVDTGCSLKVFRAPFVREMPLFKGMHRFLPTLARMQGARNIVQIEVNHRPRVHGRSKYGVWNRLWVGLADVGAVRWMQKRHLNYRVAEQAGGE